MTKANSTPFFGKRKDPHTIIIARGDQVSHFTLRPWMAMLGGSCLATLTLGYLLATSYLVLRDDLIGAGIARQARIQHAYEDRIANLREQVDRVTSRQLLDQQAVEDKIAELLERQTALSRRHGHLQPILERAGLAKAGIPVPASRPNATPDRHAYLAESDMAESDLDAAFAGVDPIITGPVPRADNSKPEGNSREKPINRSDKLFREVRNSLRSIETGQLARMQNLTENAYQAADSIFETLAAAGIKSAVSAETSTGNSGMGGPFIPVGTISNGQFEAELDELDSALERLDSARQLSRNVPIASPVSSHAVTSTFGVRTDPLIGVPALHSGIDFRAPVGQQVSATANGIVTSAGRNGGYGNMVEIDHGSGFSTRYAHMSKIDVKEGQKVTPGTIIGASGNTGRSTGPHLHYEIRRHDNATDPTPYLKAGRKIAAMF
ncbi:MAG: M23 family metallopeptidase [Phyllobacterium sp.]